MEASGMLLKRKGAEEPELLLDDLSGFPVSSRATKIRRLDAEVPPVMIHAAAPPPGGVGMREVQMDGNEEVALPTVAVDGAPVNGERAIVVYRPAEAARNLLLGPLRPEFGLRVSPDWIHGLRNKMLQEASNCRVDELSRDENSSLAMVTWAPAQATSMAAEMMDAEMDAEDTEGTSMEVEQGGGQFAGASAAVTQGEGFHQWLQHCMVPQQLPAVSQASPVMWSW